MHDLKTIIDQNERVGIAKIKKPEPVNCYQLFIGADNKKKSVNYKALEAVLGHYFDGFTIVPDCIGYWKGQVEDSALAFITCDESTMHRVCETLKETLEQEAIGVAKLENNISFI